MLFSCSFFNKRFYIGTIFLLLSKKKKKKEIFLFIFIIDLANYYKFRWGATLKLSFFFFFFFDRMQTQMLFEIIIPIVNIYNNRLHTSVGCTAFNNYFENISSVIGILFSHSDNLENIAGNW